MSFQRPFATPLITVSGVSRAVDAVEAGKDSAATIATRNVAVNNVSRTVIFPTSSFPSRSSLQEDMRRTYEGAGRRTSGLFLRSRDFREIQDVPRAASWDHDLRGHVSADRRRPSDVPTVRTRTARSRGVPRRR